MALIRRSSRPCARGVYLMLTRTAGTRAAACIISFAASLATMGCEPRDDDNSAELREEQPGVPRSANWGEYRATRHQRSAAEVLTRARLIATIVLQDDQLPSVSWLPQAEIYAWELSARNDPYREGALRFRLGERDVLARYRPATDRLTISAMDTRVRPTPSTYLDPGIGESAALSAARGCLSDLETLAVIGQGEFSRTPTVSSNHPVHFEDEAWVEQYSYMFNPNLDGLSLRSAEVVITVNAWTSDCQRITVGGQVQLTRTGDARVTLNEEAIASDRVEKHILDATPGASRVHVTGDFGYYLPVEQASGVMPPRYLATYAVESGTPDMPTLSRKSLTGLSVSDPNEAPVELLGPL